MQKSSLVVGAIAAAIGMTFALPSFAGTITMHPTSLGAGQHNDANGTYSGGGEYGYVGYTTDLDYTAYIGFANTDLNVISATLRIPVTGYFGGAHNIYVFRGKRATTNNATCNKYDGSGSWSELCGYGTSDRYTPQIGEEPISGTGYTEIELDPQEVEDALNLEARFYLAPKESGNWRAFFCNGYVSAPCAGELIELVLETGDNLDYDFGTMLPTIEWSAATTSGNGTASSTLSQKFDWAIGSATTTFPACIAWSWMQIVDTFVGMTKGDISAQGFKITPHFVASSTPYTLTTTSTVFTTDLPHFAEFTTMWQNAFAVLAWTGFGIFIIKDVMDRGKKNNAAEHD